MLADWLELTDALVDSLADTDAEAEALWLADTDAEVDSLELTDAEALWLADTDAEVD
ncbi:aminotransferase class-IV [Streptococcus oralis]|uniref:aminotransferase class-IV n=1 Tax=Streptococcus oralis TaxID=1303 RepID=UPI0028C3B3B8|nr:aminotransferase class-IV [Streptococcus oralis]